MTFNVSDIVDSLFYIYFILKCGQDISKRIPFNKSFFFLQIKKKSTTNKSRQRRLELKKKTTNARMVFTTKNK